MAIKATGSLGAGESRWLDTIIDGNEEDRVFQVFDRHTVELRQLAVRNGEASCASGSLGGMGIRNAGALSLYRGAVPIFLFNPSLTPSSVRRGGSPG